MRLEQMLQRYRWANLKLNKEKYLIRQTCIPILSGVTSRHGVSPDPAKDKALTNMLPPKMKRELQSFLVMVNYLSKFSPMTAEVCKPLRRLTLANATWTWNRSYQKSYERTKSLVKEDTCMRCIWSRLGCNITADEG